MATIALLICAGYLFFLLFVDHRESRGISAALWIPVIWMLIAASRPLIGWTPPNAAASAFYTDSSSAVDRWTLMMLGVAGVLVLARRRFNWLAAVRRHGWLFAFLAYLLLSALWSEITAVAMKRWTREAVVVVMALMVSSEAEPRRALLALFRRVAYILLPVSLLLIRYFPAYGRDYGRYDGVEMWTGVTEQKNQLGRLCMVSVLFLLVESSQLWRKRRSPAARLHLGANLSILLLGTYLLLGSHSATSLATTLLGITAFGTLRWLSGRSIRVPASVVTGAVAFLLGFGVATPFLGGTNIGAFTGSLNRDATLTGRTQIWASVMPALDQRPVLGYGIGSFWTAERRNLYQIPTAHNGYLDTLLNSGAVGLLLCAVWILISAQRFHRYSLSDREWASLCIALLGMVLIYNITESSLNSLADYITAVLLFSVVAMPGKLVPAAARAAKKTASERTTVLAPLVIGRRTASL